MSDEADAITTQGHVTGAGHIYSVSPNPSDTIRQRIMDNVLIRMESILISNGYATDIGSNVLPWRTTELAADELPCIVIVDALEEPDDVSPIGFSRWRLKIEPEIVAESGDSTAPYLRQGIADLLRAVKLDTKWSGLAIRTELQLNNIDMAQKESVFGGVKVPFTIIYQTRYMDPYNQ